MEYYLAIDIGASGGRHILGHLEDGKMISEEIYRFPNGMEDADGQKVWNVDRLWEEILTGMAECKRQEKIPVSVGIDTWAVDFVLIGRDGRRIGNAVAYRDGRTGGMDREMERIISERELYQRTGIQKQPFNTAYQLLALKKQHPKQLLSAEHFLMIPDYFHYLLTGQVTAEYTNATTTQLVGAKSRDWDRELIEAMGLPVSIFPKLSIPGRSPGKVREEIADRIGYSSRVVLPATHDTGSAVMAVPSNSERVLYISSGTWSLMGTELKTPICDERSRKCNLTNEGGYDYRFRYLKNIMGLWMIQSVKKEIGQKFSFGEICEKASKVTISSLINCNDDRFLAPGNMTEEIKTACRESGQQIPQDLAETAAVVYNSLAACYADARKELEAACGKVFDRIHIVGGGANADYLNRLCARRAGLPVYAGPVEATAVGNLCAQMIADHKFKNLQEARTCVAASFSIRKYPAEGEA